MKNNLVLASASPRRVEILQQIGIEPEVLPVDVLEIKTGTSPGQVVAHNAKIKAQAAAKLRPTSTILAADTIVVMDNQILGKPESIAQAIAMLGALSGKSHCVLTSVAVIDKGIFKTETCETLVTFSHLDLNEIEAYVATGEPMDKAGAYGIQGKGAVLVESIQGDYNNVVGLPVSVLKCLLDLGLFRSW